MKLLVTRKMTERATKSIAARFDAEFRDDAPLSVEDAAQALRDFDAVMPTLGDDFSARAFEGDDLRCKILANFGAGFNHIDVAAARAAGSGQRASHSRQTGSTRATGVCCSITSLTSTAHASTPGARHGRSRAAEAYQSTITSPVSDPAGAPTSTQCAASRARRAGPGPAAPGR